MRNKGTLFCAFELMVCCAVLFLAIGSANADPNSNTSGNPAVAAEADSSSDLYAMDLEELMKITIASKKPEPLAEAPSVVTLVPRDEFETYGDRNLLELLQRQPSIYTRGSYLYPNNLASFRGDMPTHLEVHDLILFNGRPIRESGFGGVDFPTYMALPMQSLGSVELIRGPGSVLYGTNAFSGVIDLKSRPVPDETEVSITALGGSYGYRDATLSLGGRAGDFGYTTDLRVAGQDGYDYRMTDDKEVFGSHDDDNHSVSATAHTEYRGFTFDVFAVDLSTFALGSFPRWSNPDHHFGIKRVFTNAGYEVPVLDRVKMQFNLTYNLAENHFANDTQIVGLNTSDLLGEVTVLANPLDNLNLLAGALEESRSNFSVDDDYYRSIPDYDYHPKSVYAQGDYKIGSFTKLVAGTQWNESAQGFDDTITRYGVIVTPIPNWGLKLLRGEAFRAPFAMETDVAGGAIVGNQNLRPETIATYDAQLFYNSKSHYTAVTYFHSQIDDLIIRDSSVTPASFKNGGRQKFNGLEFEAKHWLTPSWHLLGSAMYQWNYETDDLVPTTAPDFMVKLGTGYSWEWGTTAVFCTHFGEPGTLATAAVVNPEPEALSLLSLNARLDMAHWLGGPKDRTILTFKVENLLDQDIWVPEFNRGGHPNSLPDGPGTSVFGGLEYRF